MVSDELRNDQGVTRSRSAKINTTAASLYLLASYITFRILRQAQKNRANGKWQNMFWGRSDRGEDNLNKGIS
jgi:hypothetical protein